MTEDITELTVAELLDVSRPKGAAHVHVLLRLSTGLDMRLVVPDSVVGTLGVKLVVQVRKPGFQ